MTFNYEWLLRIICATIAGFLIGYERHSVAKQAGVRTHAVVAIASCLLMIISRYGFPGEERVDAARIAAQVVSGIGFLGAGIIYVQHGTLQGLSTAAGIWATSAIGLGFGAGMYGLSAFCSILVYCIQRFLRSMLKYNGSENVYTISIHLKSEGTSKDVNDILCSLKIDHAENKIRNDGEGGLIIETKVSTHKEINPYEICKELEKSDNVISAELL